MFALATICSSLAICSCALFAEVNLDTTAGRFVRLVREGIQEPLRCLKEPPHRGERHPLLLMMLGGERGGGRRGGKRGDVAEKVEHVGRDDASGVGPCGG